METYRDTSQSVEARAQDLILKMTLDEKIAQLGSSWSFEVQEDGKFSTRSYDFAPIFRNSLVFPKILACNL